MFKQTRSNLKKENVITNKEMRKTKVGSLRYKKSRIKLLDCRSYCHFNGARGRT